MYSSADTQLSSLGVPSVWGNVGSYVASRMVFVFRLLSSLCSYAMVDRPHPIFAFSGGCSSLAGLGLSRYPRKGGFFVQFQGTVRGFISLRDLAPLYRLFLGGFSTVTFYYFQLLLSKGLVFLLFRVIMRHVLYGLTGPRPRVTIVARLVYFFRHLGGYLLNRFLDRHSVP